MIPKNLTPAQFLAYQQKFDAEYAVKYLGKKNSDDIKEVPIDPRFPAHHVKAKKTSRTTKKRRASGVAPGDPSSSSALVPVGPGSGVVGVSSPSKVPKLSVNMAPGGLYISNQVTFQKHTAQALKGYKMSHDIA